MTAALCQRRRSLSLSNVQVSRPVIAQTRVPGFPRLLERQECYHEALQAHL